MVVVVLALEMASPGNQLYQHTVIPYAWSGGWSRLDSLEYRSVVVQMFVSSHTYIPHGNETIVRPELCYTNV